MHNTRFAANIIIIIILLSIIVVTAEDEEKSDDWNWDSGADIIWPSGDTYHEEWHDEVVLFPAGGTDTPLSYNDYDFQVNDYATRGLLIVNNFTNTAGEDIDITLFGASVDDNGDRRIIATSASNGPEERIDLQGTPDPDRLDDFDRGGNGTWTLRVYNYVSTTIIAMYDVSITIYYDGAEFYISEEDQDSETE